MLSRLKFSLDDAGQILALIEHHMRFRELPRMRPSTVKRFLRLPRFDQHLELHRVDCLSSHGGLDNYDFAQDRLLEFSAEEISPPPLVRGGDVMALGVAPGPRIRQLLHAVEEAQLDGSLKTRDEALEFLRQISASSPNGR
jgi:poly(A) polymerase